MYPRYGVHKAWSSAPQLMSCITDPDLFVYDPPIITRLRTLAMIMHTPTLVLFCSLASYPGLHIHVYVFQMLKNMGRPGYEATVASICYKNLVANQHKNFNQLTIRHRAHSTHVFLLLTHLITRIQQ